MPHSPSSPDPVREALQRKAERGLIGSASGHIIARGAAWLAQDVVCSSGPDDRAYEERHDWVSVAVVLRGTFTYANALGRALLTPGALLLGSAGTCFTCGHDHGEGDRCLSFHFEPAFFEEIAAAAGSHTMNFARNSLPALRSLAPLAARAALGVNGYGSIEELALDLAGTAVRENGEYRAPSISPRDERRVSSVVRYVEERFTEPCTLEDLARLAQLSPFHFLRVFRATTGLTPHQHLVRSRLRAAATALASTAMPVTEVALAVGFDDLSNFTRSFRAEYGLTPSRYRMQRG